MDQDGGTWIRPREQAWGNEAQRAVLHAIAEDVAKRTHHKVAAIEAVRSDGNLEFVAVAGNPLAHEQLLGRAAPLSLEQLIGSGTHLAGWVHVPAERMDDASRAWMAEYGHIPDLPEPDHPDGWHAEDRLVRLLENDDGELRAVLYLDEPLSGLRPTPESIAAINAETEVMYDAIVSIVERELYGEQVRMVAQARTALQSVGSGLGVEDFLREMGAAMVERMPIDSVDVLLAGGHAPSLEPHTAFFEQHMHRVWLRRGHLVVEPTQTWGAAERVVATPAVLAELMESRGIGSWLLVPIGMGEEYLGTIGLGRQVGGPRWIDSEINAAVVVARDLASVVFDARLMDTQRTLNAQLRDVNDYRRDMVRTLGHELRNPVSVLWTHLEMLGRMGLVFGPMRDSLAAMDRAARRIEDMIEALMALATVSDPDRAPAFVEVDLTAMVREVSEFLTPTATRSRVLLRTDVAEDLVVTGEEAGLHRMVTNLLSNAVKYTPDDGEVSITAVAEAVDGRDGVRLVCADTGIGIAPAELDQVFTPFFRSASSEARRRPGTGLGLAITEQVVKLHHGTVDVESVLGEGTTFSVWLPVEAPVDVP